MSYKVSKHVKNSLHAYRKRSTTETLFLVSIQYLRMFHFLRRVVLENFRTIFALSRGRRSPMYTMRIQGQFIDSKVCFRFKCFIFFSSLSLTNTSVSKWRNELILLEQIYEKAEHSQKLLIV